MKVIGTVESLWRYPVKSMRGEEITEAFMGFSGIYGDRCYAVKNSAAPEEFPYLTARLQHQMLLYRPQFRRPEKAAKPSNWSEAPGGASANGNREDLLLDVVAPSGEVVAAEDPKLLKMLGEGISDKNRLSLMRSDCALIDCRPVSLISVQTVRQLEAELNFPVDKRRFRANIYLDFAAGGGFAEDNLVGRRLRVGSRAEIAVLERDPRCKMISLDPETGEHNPQVLRRVAQAHEANAGVYAAVLTEGLLTKGDFVELLD